MGYKSDEWERAIREVPPSAKDPADWPDGVRSLTIDETELLGVDREGVLYWNGRVVTIQKTLTLSLWQKISAIIVTTTAALVALSTIAQGVASYNSWACSVQWPAICSPDGKGQSSQNTTSQ